MPRPRAMRKSPSFLPPRRRRKRSRHRKRCASRRREPSCAARRTRNGARGARRTQSAPPRAFNLGRPARVGFFYAWYAGAQTRKPAQRNVLLPLLYRRLVMFALKRFYALVVVALMVSALGCASTSPQGSTAAYIDD